MDSSLSPRPVTAISTMATPDFVGWRIGRNEGQGFPPSKGSHGADGEAGQAGQRGGLGGQRNVTCCWSLGHLVNASCRPRRCPEPRLEVDALPCIPITQSFVSISRPTEDTALPSQAASLR